MSSLYHCANISHDLCPNSDDSWCFVQRELRAGKSLSEIDFRKMKVKFTLRKEEFQAVEVYQNLTEDSVLMKCLLGKTQNPNEHIHSRVWRIIPEHKNAKRRYLDFAAAQAVGCCNFGHEESNLNALLGIPYYKILHANLQEADKKMILPCQKKMRLKIKQDSAYTPGGY